jgi:arsenate reductase
MSKKATTKTTDKLLKGKAKEKITIYHNTRCTKSREACAILEKKGVDFDTIEYLKTPLNQAELKALLKKLNLKAEEIVRKSEPLFKEKFASKKLTEAQWIKTLTENPILIERPILVKGDKAIIGRPVERVIEILK